MLPATAFAEGLANRWQGRLPSQFSAFFDQAATQHTSLRRAHEGFYRSARGLA